MEKNKKRLSIHEVCAKRQDELSKDVNVYDYAKNVSSMTNFQFIIWKVTKDGKIYESWKCERKEWKLINEESNLYGLKRSLELEKNILQKKEKNGMKEDLHGI